MKKKFSLVVVLTVFIFTISLIVSPVTSVFAEIADGSYQVNYEMKEKSSDSASIADGYFSKPATITGKDGVKNIQLTVTGADMIKKLVAPSGSVSVVSDNGDTRTVKFRVDGDLSQPVPLEMDIVVPDLYDTTHTARAVFDVSGLPEAGATPTTEDSEETTGNEDSSDGTRSEERRVGKEYRSRR